MTSKHRQRRNIRGVAAGAIGIAALAVTGGVAMGAGETTPVTTCSTALSTLHTAQNAAEGTVKDLADAIKAAKAPDAAVVTAQTNDAADDALPGHSPDPSPPDAEDKALAKAQLDATGPDAAVVEAQKANGLAQGKVSNARAAVDLACQGKPGDPGRDAQIILSPGVCARAVVTADTAEKLIKVVTIIPCPPATPPAPPKVGQPVIVVTVPAPTPQIQPQVNLPVTH